MEGNKRVRRRRRNTVERLKNLLILLLTLSAVVLTVRVLMFNGLVDKGPRGWLIVEFIDSNRVSFHGHDVLTF